MGQSENHINQTRITVQTKNVLSPRLLPSSMYSLKDIIKRYFHLLIFITLIIFAFILIYNNNNYQHFVISTASLKVTGPIQKFANYFHKQFSYPKENQYLIEQNADLLKEKDNMFVFLDDSVTSVYENEGKKNQRRLYDITTAHVVFNTIHKTHNYIIIDKGRKNGITPDMAVVSPNGVAGVVSEVSDHFSTVISLLNPNSRVSAKIMPVNQIGTVVWVDSEPDIAQMIDIPQHLLVAVGDSVVTSGYSDVFPKDILIGTVIEKFDNPSNTFLTIKIRLATDFRNLNNVYIISNLYKSELDALKSNFQNE